MRIFTLTVYDWDKWDPEDYIVKYRAEVPTPPDHDHNPIRDWIIDKACAVMCWTEEKQGQYLEIIPEQFDLINRAPIRSRIVRAIESLACEIYEAFFIGSTLHHQFTEDFPPCFYPDYHDLPDFGSFPIITT